jgi:hypothetical protein
MTCCAIACSTRPSPCEGRPVYLKHIVRCIARIEEYTADGRESFFASHLIQDGVIRTYRRWPSRASTCRPRRRRRG